MRDDRVAQIGVRHARQHCGLHDGGDLARFGTKHRETEDAIALGFDQAFMKPRVSEIVLARNTFAIGSLATRTAILRRWASASLKPSRPSCGSVNKQ
jgi:hypothetical protein